jgi:hypothetical protein
MSVYFSAVMLVVVVVIREVKVVGLQTNDTLKAKCSCAQGKEVMVCIMNCMFVYRSIRQVLLP